MVEIVLHGALRKKFNKSYNLEVYSVKEAVTALSLLVPKFKEEFMKYNYMVYCDNGSDKVYLQEDEIDAQLVANTIHIMPVVHGSKSNTQKGVGKAILAVALFFVAGPAGDSLLAAGATAKTAATAVSAIKNVALFTALRGISSILTPTVKAVEARESYSISSENSVNGVAVPLAYGETYFDVLPISVEIASSGIRAIGTSSSQPVSTDPGYSAWAMQNWTLDNDYI